MLPKWSVRPRVRDFLRSFVRVFWVHVSLRDSMLARCCHRVSVCLSVCHKQLLHRDDWTTELVLALMLHSTVRLVFSFLHCVIRKVWCLQNKSSYLWNFVLNSGLIKFRYGKWILLLTALTQCSDDNWMDAFCGKHEHGALWLCGAITETLSYLLTYDGPRRVQDGQPSMLYPHR